MGAAQIASGAIKQTSFDRAVALAKQQGIALHEALATARVMTPDQLKVALKQQTADVAVGALGWGAGQYKFEQKPVEAVSTVPDMRVSPVTLVFEAAKRRGDFASSRGWLEDHSDEHLNRSPELERDLFSLRTYWPGERSEEHTSELQSHVNLVCRLLLEKKKQYCGGDRVWTWRR